MNARAPRDEAGSGRHFPCPCCGHRTLSEPPGSFEICPVCYWEDDGGQLLDPSLSGGANAPSLMECQRHYLLTGACEERFVARVRPPNGEEPRDPMWRPVREADLGSVRTLDDLSSGERACAEAWYYWKRGPR